MAERSLRSACPVVRPLKGVLRILQGFILLPFSLLRGKADVVRKLGLIFFGCGILVGFCGYRYRAYEFKENGRG